MKDILNLILRFLVIIGIIIIYFYDIGMAEIKSKENKKIGKKDVKQIKQDTFDRHLFHLQNHHQMDFRPVLEIPPDLREQCLAFYEPLPHQHLGHSRARPLLGRRHPAERSSALKR